MSENLYEPGSVVAQIHAERDLAMQEIKTGNHQAKARQKRLIELMHSSRLIQYHMELAPRYRLKRMEARLNALGAEMRGLVSTIKMVDGVAA